MKTLCRWNKNITAWGAMEIGGSLRDHLHVPWLENSVCMRTYMWSAVMRIPNSSDICKSRKARYQNETDLSLGSRSQSLGLGSQIKTLPSELQKCLLLLLPLPWATDRSSGCLTPCASRRCLEFLQHGRHWQQRTVWPWATFGWCCGSRRGRN